MFRKVFQEALQLLLTGDPIVLRIIGRSLQVSVTAVIIAAVIGVPFGFFLGLRRFPGKGLLVRLTYVFMGMPPVLAGLLVFMLLSRSGPIGKHLYLLFTPTAMIIAQVLLAFPIVAGLIMAAVEEKADLVLLTSRTLGAGPFQAKLTLIAELKIALIIALVTAFGRVSAEVGAVTLVGGDIDGFTRVLTTAIVLETRKGRFEMALALGIVLLLISFAINSILYKWQYRGNK